MFNKDTSGLDQAKITISVGGMTCAACVRRVENALNSVPGVLDASVNLATGRATIIHGPRWGGITALEKVITEQGYDFLGELQDNLADPIEASRARELKELKLKVTCGAILSVIIFIRFNAALVWFSANNSPPDHALGHVYLNCSRCFLGGQPFFHRRD